MEVTKYDILDQIANLEKETEKKKLLRIYKKVLFQANHPFLNKIFRHKLSMDEIEMLRKTKEGLDNGKSKRKTVSK